MRQGSYSKSFRRDSYNIPQESEMDDHSSDIDEDGNNAVNLDDKKSLGLLLCSKFCVYACLTITAITTAVTTYVILSEDSNDNVEIAFNTHAKRVSTLIEGRLGVSMRALEEMSMYATLSAVDVGAEWPEFTLSHFDVRAREFFIPTTDGLIFAPVVEQNELSSWLTYASEINPGAPPTLGSFGTNTFVPGAPYVPIWQEAAVGNLNSNNLLRDLNTATWFTRLTVHAKSHAVLSELVQLDLFGNRGDSANQPRPPDSAAVFAVAEDREPVTQDSKVAGYVVSPLSWSLMLSNILDEGEKGYMVVVSDGCENLFSCELDGPRVVFLGDVDSHDLQYDGLVEKFTVLNSTLTACPYTISVYPTANIASDKNNREAILFSVAIFSVFVFAGLIFLAYDWMMQQRQGHLEHQARQTTAIVSSLFPENVQQRLIQGIKDQEEQNKQKDRDRFLRDFVGEDVELERAKANQEKPNNSGSVHDSPPIADLFPECSVMFADIAGFTAWSSTREPTQVFVLLENLYHEMDMIAKRRKVFKVETIGDCYVAVVGLPTPRKDHAVVMCQFARECMSKTNTVTKSLEERLGPDTGDLNMRIGLHSGPVTAGVLRGEKARFQLFGDTVNTTARVESLGQKGRIHLSEDCAKLIMAAGKEHWLQKREDRVSAKGKGLLTTFWLEFKSRENMSVSGHQSVGTDATNDSGFPKVVTIGATEDHGKDEESSTSTTAGGETEPAPLSDKGQRLVKWNVDVMSRLLRSIVARRQAAGSPHSPMSAIGTAEAKSLDSGVALDEVKEIISLPVYDPEVAAKEIDPNTIELDVKVTDQLHQYIQTIASLYRENSFHNFEHVSHVTMSVVKLLSRIVAPHQTDEADYSNARSMHDHTYGITSDPLTQFAVVFSALIHDVDHRGIPNTQLVKEKANVAKAYSNRSVAEQNSLDIGWFLLMDESFAELRSAIYSTTSEFQRFRQLVVNAIIATDIMDKGLSAARKARWNTAFSMDDSSQENKNRKATIVIEHLIQASDVAHTMQHWHVFRKWNQRLFIEMSEAYRNGRAEKDPADNWYEGEKGFFDFYVIPLAKKLKDCGVFGVSSDEYLNYAQKNRAEWEIKGKEIVAEMVNSFRQEHQ